MRTTHASHAHAAGCGCGCGCLSQRHCRIIGGLAVLYLAGMFVLFGQQQALSRFSAFDNAEGAVAFVKQGAVRLSVLIGVENEEEEDEEDEDGDGNEAAPVDVCASKLPFTSKPPRSKARRKSESARVVLPKLGPITTAGWIGPCDEQLGFGMVDRWAAKMAPVCVGSRGAAAGAAEDGIWCASTVHAMMPAPTAPHVLCRARNLVLDFERMGRRTCPSMRPGYMCENPATYLDYEAGSVTSPCEWAAHVNRATYFPRDLLADMFRGFASEQPREAERTAAHTAVLDGPALLVSRERGEHFNLYHSMTDFVNAFISCYVHGWDPADVTIILMDAHVEGPFDNLWHSMFAGALHARDFGTNATAQPEALRATRVRLLEAAISPPGYTSVFFSRENLCEGSTGLLRQFARYMLNSQGVAWQARDRTAPVQITFIARRPYRSFVDHSYMGRQIVNMRELLDALRALPNVQVHEVDFAQYALRDQLAIVAQTDLLVGMHGAALTHGLFLPSHAGVLELRTVSHQAIMYRHTSVWSGLLYKQWLVENANDFCIDGLGDYTRVDVAAVSKLVAELVAEMSTR